MAQAENTFDRIKRYYTTECITETVMLDKSFSDQELQQLFNLYEPFSKWGIIWRIFTETGMRPIEMCNLHIQNFDLQKQELCFKVFKPRKKMLGGSWIKYYKCRKTYLSEELCCWIQQYFDLNIHSFVHGFIFPHHERNKLVMHPRTINNEFDRARKVLRGRFLDKDSTNNYSLLSPKSFRITFISRVVDKLGIDSAARIVRHEDLRTTMRYVKPVSDQVIKEVKNCFKVVKNQFFLADDQTTLI